MGIPFWLEKWEKGETPWDLGGPHPSLPQLVSNLGIFFTENKRAKAVEIGCGGGHDSFFLAEQGFDVTGIDLSAVATRQARLSYQEAVDAGRLRFVAADIFDDTALPYLSQADLIYDRALLCALPEQARARFKTSIATHLKVGCLYASIIAAKLSPAVITGPPFALTENELLEMVGPQFDLVYFRKDFSAKASPSILEEFLFIVRKRVG